MLVCCVHLRHRQNRALTSHTHSVVTYDNAPTRRIMMEPGTPGFGAGGGGSSLPPPLQPLEVHITKWQRKYQQTLDKLTPHMYQRWAGTAGLIALFMLRIVFSQGVSSFLREFLPTGGALTPFPASGISVSYQRFCV